MDALAAERRSRAIREQESFAHNAYNNEMVTRKRVEVCEAKIEALTKSFLECHDRLAALEALQGKSWWSKVRRMLTFRRNGSQSGAIDG